MKHLPPIDDLRRRSVRQRLVDGLRRHGVRLAYATLIALLWTLELFALSRPGVHWGALGTIPPFAEFAPTALALLITSVICVRAVNIPFVMRFSTISGGSGSGMGTSGSGATPGKGPSGGPSGGGQGNARTPDRSTPPIINHPASLQPFRRGTELSVTLIGWTLWIFLCRPVIMLILWFIGLRIFYEQMIRLQGLSAILDFLPIYLGVLLAIGVAMRLWNFYNLKRFSGKDRRKAAPHVDNLEMDAFFKLKDGGVGHIHHWNDIAIDFNGQGQLVFRHGVQSFPAVHGHYDPANPPTPEHTKAPTPSIDPRQPY